MLNFCLELERSSVVFRFLTCLVICKLSCLLTALSHEQRPVNWWAVALLIRFYSPFWCEPLMVYRFIDLTLQLIFLLLTSGFVSLSRSELRCPLRCRVSGERGSGLTRPSQTLWVGWFHWVTFRCAELPAVNIRSLKKPKQQLTELQLHPAECCLLV